MTKAERAVLSDAASIIKRALEARGEVSIRGFGKFYRTTIYVYEDVQPAADLDEFLPSKLKSRISTRFRAYRSYFKQVNPEAK